MSMKLLLVQLRKVTRHEAQLPATSGHAMDIPEDEFYLFLCWKPAGVMHFLDLVVCWEDSAMISS